MAKCYKANNNMLDKYTKVQNATLRQKIENPKEGKSVYFFAVHLPSTEANIMII